jgi:hypothetical protein
VPRLPNVRASRTAALTTAAPPNGPVVMDALAARYGGAAYAAVQLAHSLADDPAVDEIIVLARDGSLVAEGIRPRRGLRLIALPKAKRFELARRPLWEAFGLPALSRRLSASSVATWSGMLPRRVDAPVVCYLANPVIFERRGLPIACAGGRSIGPPDAPRMCWSRQGRWRRSLGKHSTSIQKLSHLASITRASRRQAHAGPSCSASPTFIATSVTMSCSRLGWRSHRLAPHFG